MKVNFGGLWGHPDFLKLWAGQTVSLFGSEITTLALPLTAVLVLQATPVQMGLLQAAGSLPVFATALVAGVWVDRVRRRPLLIGADLGRASLLGSIPIAAFLHILSIDQLYIVALLVGALTVLFDTAYTSFLPSLLGQDQLVEGNSRLEVSRSLAQIAGPGFGGVLVQLVTAPIAIAVDALSFFLSALSLGLIRGQERVPLETTRRGRVWEEAAEGLRFLLRHPYLSPLAACSATLNGFGGVFDALYVLDATRILDVSPAVLGLLYACGSVAWLLGATFVVAVSRRYGQGRTILIGAIFVGLTGFALPVAGVLPGLVVPILAAGRLCAGVGNPLYNITGTSVRQAITPDRLLGRVSAGMMFLALGINPLGALLGGWLAESIGMWETLLLAAFGLSLAFVWILRSPLRSLGTAQASPQMG